MKRSTKRKWIGLGLGIVGLGARWLAGQFPEITETLYARGAFSLLRWGWDYSLGYSPFPLLFLGIMVLLGVGGWSIWKYWKNPEKPSWSKRIGSFVLSLGAWAGGAVFFFMIAWGLNYGRVPIEQHLNLPIVTADLGLLRAEFELATEEALLERAGIPGPDKSYLEVNQLLPELEDRMRGELSQTLEAMAYPAPGRPRARRISPAGFLIGWGASGVYLPFTGEGQVDAGVPDLLQAPVIAHELAHAYGFGDEGTCNFLAYLACVQSGDPFIRYCGRLFYWREVAGEYYRYAPEAYTAIRDSLPSGFLADLDEIRRQNERYRPWLPRLSNWLYDGYLKSQGMEEGIKNYDRVVGLVMGKRRKE